MSEKGRNGLHRSPSDAGRSSSGDEAKKQPTILPASRGSTATTSTFGFKKQGLVTLVTASGATITSGSATLGKLPKSGQRPLVGGLKLGGGSSSSDGGPHLHHPHHHHQDDSFLPMSARSTLQYRSLPRPSRSSSSSTSSAAARHGNRSSTSSIEAATLSVTSQGKSPLGLLGKAGGPATNQTDREKGVSEVDSLRGGAPQTGRQQVSSPTLRR